MLLLSSKEKKVILSYFAYGKELAFKLFYDESYTN